MPRFTPTFFTWATRCIAAVALGLGQLMAGGAAQAEATAAPTAAAAQATISGAVARPGTYSLAPGDRLSDLIARAGGLTENAFPLGAVFTREAVRRQEQAARDALVASLELSLGAVLKRHPPSYGLYKDLRWAVDGVRQAVATLRDNEAVGRMVVEADPLVLKVRPEQDTTLQPGDALAIPARPAHVAVLGAVHSPGAQRFQSALAADRYIELAGGPRRDGDIGRAFAVLPNGSARQLAVSFWNYRPEYIPPGSTIILPIEPDPYQLLELGDAATRLLSLVTTVGPDPLGSIGLHDTATRILVETAVRAADMAALVSPIKRD